VLDKFRHMRRSDPLPGYDALSPDEIATALSGADAETVNALRDYKRKFACRRQVMEEPRESFRRRLRVHEKRATGKSKTRAYMRDSQVARKPAVALPIAGRRRRSTTDVDAPPAAKRASHAGAVERAEAARDEREQLREEAGYRQERLALLSGTALRWTSGQPGQAPGAPAGLRRSLHPSPPGRGSAPPARTRPEWVTTLNGYPARRINADWSPVRAPGATRYRCAGAP
jgi:hypothetical protein